MDLGIAGKRALVLASSRGLGKGIAVAQAMKAALDPKNLFNPGKVPFRAD